MRRGDLVGYRQKDGSIRAMLFLRSNGKRHYFLSKGKYSEDIAITVLYTNDIKKKCFVAAGSEFGGANIVNEIEGFFERMTKICTECFKEDNNES